MFISDIDPKDFLDWVKSQPTCDGVNHDWIHEEDDEPGEEHCAGCFVIRGTENEVE